MDFLPDLTRTVLTRSPRPFLFLRGGERRLAYEDEENLGLYVHIPFCRKICAFCPYCKTLYRREEAEAYVRDLLREIELTASGKPKKRATSLYFGGGSPALLAERVGEIVGKLREHFEITGGIGIELHPDDVKEETLRLLKDAGVTRLSIGVQSFGKKFQRILGRPPFDPRAMKKVLDAVKFETVSMDFIFALPGQTAHDLLRDVRIAEWVGANHVALYPLIDFSFTGNGIPAMPNGRKRRLLRETAARLASRGFRRTTIWTFAKGDAAYSSMTRESFLGFGVSAVSLLRKSFRINTFSLAAYRERIKRGALPTALTLRFTERQRMVYWLFWTAYGMEVREKDFERFFGVPLRKAYGKELLFAKAMGYVTEKDGVWRMTDRGAFAYHLYEKHYTYAYIDKMWNLLRREAYPEKIVL